MSNLLRFIVSLLQFPGENERKSNRVFGILGFVEFVLVILFFLVVYVEEVDQIYHPHVFAVG